MLGTQEIPGILPCAVRDVFNGIKNVRKILIWFILLNRIHKITITTFGFHIWKSTMKVSMIYSLQENQILKSKMIQM